jgi:hypothetical protein
MSRERNAGQNRNAKIRSKSSERVEQFKQFGKPVTNQNPIHEEIKSRLQPGNACIIR